MPPRARRLRLCGGVGHPVVLPPGAGMGVAARRPGRRVRIAGGATVARRSACRSGRLMDFELGPDARLYRDRVRAIVAEHHTPEAIRVQHESGTFDNPALVRALAAEGLIERAVPGLGAGDPIELWILFNEIEKAGAPVDALAVAVMVAGVVQHVGTPRQKAELIPAVTSGNALVCLGYSEPDAGSDLAALSTRAVPDGDEWVIN